MSRSSIRVGLLALSLCVLGSIAGAAPYTISKTDGGNWQTLYAQGFNSSLGATPNPGLSNGAPVYLTQFEFFKSGTADTRANIKLAIINNLFPSNPTVNNMTSTSATVVGLSTSSV